MMLRKFDPWLCVSASSLVLLGLIMIASASIDIASAHYSNSFHFLFRHGLFVVLATALFFVSTQISIARWQLSSGLLLFLGLGVLLLVLLPGVGKTVNGSTRWISLGFFNVQPSEIAKLFIVTYLAAYLVRRADEVAESWWGFLKPMIILSTTAVLLLLEPDFGATVVIGVTFLGMIFISGAKLGQFTVFVSGCLSVVVLMILSSEYRTQRLLGYIDPWQDAYGSGYQLTQSLIAFGRGDWLGLGLGNSVQKQFYLPEAHTDFVFAIIAEEFGLVGSVLVIVLFAVLFVRIFQTAYRCHQVGHVYASYLVFGLGLMMAFQALINLGVNMGILPTKGLTLPFVSYGGSSLVMASIALGIVQRARLEVLAVGAQKSTSKTRVAGGIHVPA